MEQETQTFIENVDAWIKQIREELSEVTDVSNIVQEHDGNIQHNYELIQELKDEVDILKREFQALKLIQLMNLKERLIKKN